MRTMTRTILAVLPVLVLAACDSGSPSGPDNQPQATPKTLTLEYATTQTTVTAQSDTTYVIHNTMTPLVQDSTIEYRWEITEVSTPTGQWAFSICDAENCRPVGATSYDFRFTHGFPGLFYIDWINRDTSLTDMATGDCRMVVRIFPKSGADTTWYTSVMRVSMP